MAGIGQKFIDILLFLHITTYDIISSSIYMSISAPVSSLYDSPDRREPEQIVRDIQDKLCKGNLAPSDFIESFDRHNKKQKWYPIMEMLQFGYLAESDLREWVG